MHTIPDNDERLKLGEAVAATALVAFAAGAIAISALAAKSKSLACVNKHSERPRTTCDNDSEPRRDHCLPRANLISEHEAVTDNRRDVCWNSGAAGTGQDQG